MSYNYHHAPRETWDAKKCARAAKAAPKNYFGDRPPKGIVQGDSDPYPRYGRQRFNGGTVIDGEWYDGTDNPYPAIPEPYVFAVLSSWGTIITTREDAEARRLSVLNLNEEGL